MIKQTFNELLTKTGLPAQMLTTVLLILMNIFGEEKKHLFGYRSETCTK